jgi:hypothetical protein
MDFYSHPGEVPEFMKQEPKVVARFVAEGLKTHWQSEGDQYLTQQSIIALLPPHPSSHCRVLRIIIIALLPRHGA